MVVNEERKGATKRKTTSGFRIMHKRKPGLRNSRLKQLTWKLYNTYILYTY